MVQLGDFIPFYPKKTGEPGKPRFDVERALRAQLHAHPTLEQHRAANGELVLVVERELHTVETFLARFVKVNRYRRIVLDRYGEFMLSEALKPDTTLGEAAARLAREFGVEDDKARMGTIQLVRDLLVRGFVFLVTDR